MPFDKRSLVIPDGTRFEERTIIAPGDFVLGNHTRVEFGLRTDARIFAGESAKIQGAVSAGGELRFDHFCTIEGDVEAKGNVYLGEKTRVEGKLLVGGDLDVGDDVAITKGFEAKGWINIRSPVPIVMYLFLYLMELLRMGKSEEVDKILKDLQDATEQIQIGEKFLYLPDRSSLGLQHSTIHGNFFVGKECRILGNYNVKGNATIGPGTKLYGALRAQGTVKLQGGSEVQGTLETLGKVVIGEGCRVLGDVRALEVEMFPSSVVDGRIVAPNGVKFTTQQSLAMDDKMERYEAGMVDNIVDLLG
ncbi:MAG TPA: polymer-forming cytoskeletal protein [Candidatus Thermoplasmatota archaeon]|nr:polymer-forming cytoskeletal protein [Candidatus Thermoplasmatota archaeon]